jgi:hemerythrin-like domain-containing protein
MAVYESHLEAEEAIRAVAGGILHSSAVMQPIPTPRTLVRHRLLDDHARLLRGFEEVLARLRADDRDQTRVAWARFESSLLWHLEAEEHRLLPAFGKVHAEEAAVLYADHAQFRRRIDELGIAVDLHTIRADEAAELVETLDAHSRREDRGMYAWAEASLDANDYEDLHRRLTGPGEGAA